MNGSERLQTEIARLLSVIDDVWILRQILLFIQNMTKGTEYEQAE